MTHALVNGWHAAVRVGLQDRREASLVLAAVQPRLERVHDLAAQALEGSRPERREAIAALIEFTGVDTPELRDFVVAAVTAGIQEAARAEGWGAAQRRTIETLAIESLRRFDRQISALADLRNLSVTPMAR